MVTTLILPRCKENFFLSFLVRSFIQILTEWLFKQIIFDYRTDHRSSTPELFHECAVRPETTSLEELSDPPGCSVTYSQSL
jgi:hypothetical protein